MPINFNFVSLGLAITLAVSSAIPAHAGHWEVQWKQETVNSYLQNGISNSVKASSDWTVIPGNICGSAVPLVFVIEQAASAYRVTWSRTYTPRLHWIADNASDLPPKVAIVVEAFYAHASTSSRLLANDDPAVVNGITAFGSTSVGNVPISLRHFSNDGIPGVNKSGFLTKHKIHRLDNPDQNFYLVLPTGTGTVGFSSDADHSTPYVSGQLYFGMAIIAPQLSLKVRRRGSGDGYTSATTTAAGSFAGHDEHVVDVRLELAIPQYPHSTSTTPIDLTEQRAHVQAVFTDIVPELIRGNGVKINAKFETGPDPDSPPPLNSIYLGKFVTSDRSLDASGVSVQFPVNGATIKVLDNVPMDSSLPGATIQQLWDQEGDWKSGPTGEEPFDPYINYDEPTPITFRPKFSGVPITGHSIKIGAKHVQVLEWDETLETSVTRIYTTVARLQNLNANPPVIYKEDLGEYVTASPGVSSDLGGGVYRTTLTVPFDPDKIVQDITLKVEDQQVYRAIVR